MELPHSFLRRHLTGKLLSGRVTKCQLFSQAMIPKNIFCCLPCEWSLPSLIFPKKLLILLATSSLHLNFFQSQEVICIMNLSIIKHASPNFVQFAWQNQNEIGDSQLRALPVLVLIWTICSPCHTRNYCYCWSVVCAYRKYMKFGIFVKALLLQMGIFPGGMPKFWKFQRVAGVNFWAAFIRSRGRGDMG